MGFDHSFILVHIYDCNLFCKKKLHGLVLKIVTVHTRLLFFPLSQTLRDEMVQLEERYHQDVNRQKSERKQLMERHAAEQLSIREELRKELAQVHMEKFSAMAAELSHVHKVRNKNGCWTSGYKLIIIFSVNKNYIIDSFFHDFFPPLTDGAGYSKGGLRY